MRSVGPVSCAALAWALVSSSVHAQAAPPTPTGPVPAPAGTVGSTVDGALPARAASTTAVGRTKPPGAAAPGTNPTLDAKSRQLDRKIHRGICNGC